MIEKVCCTAIDCVDVWVDASKKMGKRRVFSDFLKLLDSWGLSKHRALFMEVKYKLIYGFPIICSCPYLFISSSKCSFQLNLFVYCNLSFPASDLVLLFF